MARPLLIALEKANLPTLIIDKEGSIGIGLVGKFRELFQVVFASSRESEEHKNVLFFPYKDKVPQIPSDTYNQMFFVVSSEKEIEDVLPSLIEKSQVDKSKLFIVGSREVLTTTVIENIFSQSKDCFVILLGDIFGNPLVHRKQNLIEKLFYSAKAKKEIVLPGLGLSKLYPVSFEDVIIELVRFPFAHGKKTHLFFLHSQYPITTLGLSRMLQKSNPLLKIDFKKGEDVATEQIVSLEGEYLIPQEYALFEKLEKAYKSFTGEEIENPEVEDQPHVLHSEHLQNNFPRFYILKTFVSFILVFVVSFFVLQGILIGGFGFVAEKAFTSGIHDVLTGNTNVGKSKISFANTLIEGVKYSLPVLSFETNLFGKHDFFDSIQKEVTLGQTGIHTVEGLLQIQELIKQSPNKENTLFHLVTNLKNAIVTLQKASQEKNSLVGKNDKLIQVVNTISPFISTVENLPAIFGSDKKVYLILFQNNAELRPGGGFIGSYGLLTVEKGQVKDFSIKDIYDADGQLKGHIEPPFQIRRYLKSPHLYLRDSNFDVDFTKNAFTAAFLLNLETGQKVDGVIGIDLSLIKNILEAVGPLYIPEYKETVTKDNFFLLAENHAEKNFFPGSTQKKDFLRSVFVSIQERIIKEKNINYLTLLERLSTAAKEKHLLFAFSNISIQDTFVVSGLSSSLWDKRDLPASAMQDFIGINEANLGINKVNYFVSRSIRHTIAIGNDGQILEQLHGTYINTSNGQWPGGTYTNYIRFILPQDATLTKILIGGVEQKIVPAITNATDYEAKNFIPPLGLEVEKTQEEGKTIYGFLTSVPAKTSQDIDIFYTLAKKVDVSLSTFTYSLKVFKQPGIESSPYLLQIAMPVTYKMIKASEEMKIDGNNITYQKEIATDKEFIVSFAKK